MKSKIFLLILIVAGFTINCKKESDKCIDLYIDEKAKSYGAFQIRSYWIYQNDSTFEVDSVYCNGIHKDWSNDCAYHHENHEGLGCEAKSTLDTNITISYSINATSGGYSELLYSGGKNADSLIDSWRAESNLRTYGPAEDLFQKSDIVPSIELTLNGILYTSVYELEGELFRKYDKVGVSNIYIVNGLGVIKWTLQNQNGSYVSWSLLRHHIVL
jgi:hypothetical protein